MSTWQMNPAANMFATHDNYDWRQQIAQMSDYWQRQQNPQPAPAPAAPAPRPGTAKKKAPKRVGGSGKGGSVQKLGSSVSGGQTNGRMPAGSGVRGAGSGGAFAPSTGQMPALPQRQPQQTQPGYLQPQVQTSRTIMPRTAMPQRNLGPLMSGPAMDGLRGQPRMGNYGPSPAPSPFGGRDPRSDPPMPLVPMGNAYPQPGYGGYGGYGGSSPGYYPTANPYAGADMSVGMRAPQPQAPRPVNVMGNGRPMPMPQNPDRTPFQGVDPRERGGFGSAPSLPGGQQPYLAQRMPTRPNVLPRQPGLYY